MSAEGPNEIVQGKNMVDAAKEAGVKFFIFSYDFVHFQTISTDAPTDLYRT